MIKLSGEYILSVPARWSIETYHSRNLKSWPENKSMTWVISYHFSFVSLSKPHTSIKTRNENMMWSRYLSAQSCPTLCDPMDCSLQGSSVHGIFQARVLEWVAISFSRGCSRSRDWTRVFCIATDALPSEPSGKRSRYSYLL